MSVASSVFNSTGNGLPWIEGQRVIGSITETEIPQIAVPSGTPLTSLLTLSEGVWAVTPNVLLTGQYAGTTINDVAFKISQNAGLINYNQSVYIDAPIPNVGNSLLVSTNFFVVVNNGTNTSPLTFNITPTYTLNGGTNILVSGVITFIRIA
jgi:hypothetical protein